MRQSKRFETEIQFPKELAGRVEQVTEEDAEVKPRIERDVYRLASLASRAAFLLVAGCLVVLAIVARVERWEAWLVALALATTAGAATYLIVLDRQWKWYKRQVIRRRTYGLAADPPPVAATLEPVAGNRQHIRPAEYPWRENQKRQFARRLIADDGRWTGGRCLRRKHIEGIIPHYTKHWSSITADALKWGWVRKEEISGRHPDYPFTTYGKQRIRQWRDPPTQAEAEVG